MINGVDFRPSRTVESRARRLAKEIAGTVHVRLEAGEASLVSQPVAAP